MKELARHILDYIIEDSEVPEDLLYEFSKETLRIIQNRQTTSLPDTFWELENYVETFWRNSEFTHIENPCVLYQMGRLLSSTNLISMMADEEERELSIEDYAEQWRNRYIVFHCIHRQKGITHKMLAEASNMSISALSQFVNKVKWTGVFNCRVMGREKHYYLTEYGEQIYDYMRRKAEKENPWKINIYNFKVSESKFKKFLDTDNEEKEICVGS